MCIVSVRLSTFVKWLLFWRDGASFKLNKPISRLIYSYQLYVTVNATLKKVWWCKGFQISGHYTDAHHLNILNCILQNHNRGSNENDHSCQKTGSAITSHIEDNQNQMTICSQHGFKKVKSHLLNLISFYDKMTHLADE